MCDKGECFEPLDHTLYFKKERYKMTEIDEKHIKATINL